MVDSVLGLVGLGGRPHEDGSASHLSEADVVRWFADASTSSVLHVLDKAAEKQVTEPGKQKSRSRNLAETLGIKIPARKAKAAQPGDDTAAGANLPIIGLSSNAYYADESKTVVHLEAIRINGYDKVSRVSFTTREGSAKAGKAYRHKSDVLTFNKGDTVVSFTIDLVPNDTWNNTLEFFVELLPDDRENCSLDTYLSTGRVSIIDDDTFPSRYFKDMVENDQLETVWATALMWGIFRHLFFADVKIMRAALTQGIVVQFDNMILLWKLLSKIWIVDCILKPYEDDTGTTAVSSRHDPAFQAPREGYLTQIVAIGAVVFVVKHFLNNWKCSNGLTGPAEVYLKRALALRYLHYSEDSRSRVEAVDLLIAMELDATEVIIDGYNGIHYMFQKIGKIIVMNIYFLLSPAIFDKKYHIAPVVVPALVYPILLFGFAALRRRRDIHLNEQMDLSERDVLATLREVAVNLRLIADYRQQLKYERILKDTAKVLKARQKDVKAFALTNEYFPKWISVTLLCLYVFLSGAQVIDGVLSLGVFLANVAALQEVGGAWAELYEEVHTIQVLALPIRTIVTFLNLPTDLPQRSRLSRHNRERMLQLREEAIRKEKKELLHLRPHGPAVDMIDIELGDLLIASPIGEEIHLAAKHVSIKQGQMVGIIGGAAQGKATLLKVLGGAILPKTGRSDPGLFVPSQLRVLHVAIEPIFFKGSLFRNLTLGVMEGTRDGDKARIRTICERLGMDDQLLSLVESEDDEHAPYWTEVLSQTQAHIVCLARAFIANPEVLCVHKPTQPFDASQSVRVMKYLKEFIEHRGVQLGTKSMSLRRPCTVVYTSSEHLNNEYADVLFSVSRKDGVRQVHHVKTPVHLPPGVLG